LLKLEKLARDKHSSLFQTFVNYGRKKVLQHLAPELHSSRGGGERPEGDCEVELSMRRPAVGDDSRVGIDDVARLVLLPADAVDDVLLLRRCRVQLLRRVERAEDVGLKKGHISTGVKLCPLPRIVNHH
jgi:hypothetical protein